MEIRLYKNTSEDRQINKNLMDEIVLTGSIRDDSVDIMDPIITVNSNIAYIDYNYCYIPDFHRYYFFSAPPTIVRTGVFQLLLHVDVLMSFKGTPENGYSDGFLGNAGLVETTANYGNFYLMDPQLPLQQNSQITLHKNYDSPFSRGSSSQYPSTIVINATNVGNTSSIPQQN